MFGPGNYTQYSVVTYIGKESEKEWKMYMPKLIHLAAHLKLTQCCKSTTPQNKNSVKKIIIKLRSLLYT